LADSVEKFGHGFHEESTRLKIKIFALSRGCRAQISRSGAQKGVFSDQYAGSLEEPTFSTESADSRLSASVQSINSSCEKAPHGTAGAGLFMCCVRRGSRTNFCTNDCVLAGDSELVLTLSH
jgi:hypothetical protein